MKDTDVPAFVRDLAFADLPDDVVAQATRCLLDLIGVAAAGSTTRAAAIASAYAATQLCARDHEARLLFDGRRAGVAGAAFAGATTIDAIDAHDGHVLTKGHAGVAILPALLALIDGGVGVPGAAPVDGREFITCLVLGYEVATRAGIALHCSVPDYHCSGAWNALGCAAVAARRLGFDAATTREALGIAEYFGPRGPDPARLRPPDDGEGRLRLGRPRRRHRRAARPRRLHRRAGAHDRARGRRGPVGRPRHALADSRAILQGVPGVPLGAAGDRGGARAAAGARLRRR